MIGVQTCLVFVISAVLFCENQQSQCLTLVKSLSILIITIGTIVYGLGKEKDKQYNGLPQVQNASSDIPLPPSNHKYQPLDSS